MLGVRTGDKGRGRNGEPLPNFEPGSDILARVTILCEGTQGHLTGVALDTFGLEGENPQVWALGVKEVWKVERPLHRVVHTMGWPLRAGAKYREFGGSFIYPMGDDMLTLGMVVGLDYRDAELSVHDLLQELKKAGAIATFLGTARAHSRGRTVLHLDYEAYEGMAEQMMAELAASLKERYEITAIAIHHRVGRVEIGEASVVIAVSGPHRADTLAACQDAIDTLEGDRPALEEGGLRGRRGMDRPRLLNALQLL